MKYRKKPVIINAVRWDGTKEGWEKIFNEFFEIEKNDGKQDEVINDYLVKSLKLNEKFTAIHVLTLEGTMFAYPGHYIIRGVKGEYYPCKADIFEMTYEAV